ncbi:Uma2 family endonuclease [Hyalangium rubrum]|uniref:Uma2 family endonuclease n=1 Tax=Hyalangium rubrum TaxID=3103134 RepID=A0ABU5HDG6_9BACT|nr:Uma2 family endonuclease [Hyalangium sp. s54d21]MDY7231315.1 Uma2 family endonuclease [Hyalangium sp. s54d21]
MMLARVVMSEKPRRPATYEDLEALPPHQVGEIIAGELYASPRPATPHARAASRLGVKLGGPFDIGGDNPGGWVILHEPELHLGTDVLVPDLAGWRRERMPKLPRVPALKLAPDWVCEVLSPSTEARDRSAKFPIYAREGVRHVWLVDPDVRTLEIFRLEGPRYTLLATHEGEASVHAEPFEALALSLRVLWED